MIYLDTNAFYYSAGLSQNGKYDVERLRKYIQMENTVCISIASIYEFIIKWEKNVSMIRKGVSFISENDIKILNNPYYKIPKNFISNLYNIKEDEIDSFINSFITDKIDTEARITSILFSICFIVFVDFSNEYINELGTELLRNLMRTLSNIDIDIFREIYREGYRSGNCENYVRKSFDNYMAFWLQNFSPIIETAYDAVTYEQYLDTYNSLDWSSISEKIGHDINKSQSTMTYIKKKVQRIIKQKDNDFLDNYFANIRYSINKKIKQASVQEYLTEIIRKFIINGSPLWKNDIIDALILAHLFNDDDVFITFDEGVISHMTNNTDINSIYSKSIDKINILKAI